MIDWLYGGLELCMTGPRKGATKLDLWLFFELLLIKSEPQFQMEKRIVDPNTNEGILDKKQILLN